MWNREGTIHYLVDPICITIHDTGSNTYHDTLLFRIGDAWQGVSACFFVFWCCISFEYHRFYKLLCLGGASYTILSVINGYAKAFPYHWLSSNWLCKRNLTVISHFNKVCFGFHWYRLKCLTCCVQIILEWALSVSSFNGYVYRSIYRQIECLDISFVIIS